MDCWAWARWPKAPVAPALAVLVVGGVRSPSPHHKIFSAHHLHPRIRVVLAIVLPWYLAVQHKVPQFFRVFFIEHNLERLWHQSLPARAAILVYIPVFVLATLHGRSLLCLHSSMLDASAIKLWRGANAEPPTTTAEPADDGLSSFLFLWALVPIIFFSISRAKLPGYILPAIPAATLLTADYLHRESTLSRVKIALHSLLCAILL